MFKPSPAHRNTVWAFLAQMVTFWHLLLRSADLAAAAQGQPALHTPDTLFPTAGRIDNISVRSLRHGGARHSRCARWGAEGKHETKITRVKTQSHTAEPAWSQAFLTTPTQRNWLFVTLGTPKTGKDVSPTPCHLPPLRYNFKSKDEAVRRISFC